MSETKCLTELELAKIDHFNAIHQLENEKINNAKLKFVIEEKSEEICKLNKKLLLNTISDIKNKLALEERKRLEYMNGVRSRLGLSENEVFGYNPETGELA